MGNVESGPGEPGSESNPLKVSENPPRHPEPEYSDRRSRSWEDLRYQANDDWAPVDNEDWAPVDNRDWVDQENNGDFRNTTPPQDDKPGSIGYEQDSYEEVETDPEEDSAYMSDNGTQSLMGASAAVFHYLELAENRQQAAYLQDHQSEDMSVSDRSAAVFRFLEEEAVRGNPKHIVKFLETASVVSQVLLDDANSVSDASAAVFRVLEKNRGSVPKRKIQRPPPPNVIKVWDEPRNIDEDSSASVSEHSNAIVNKVLDDTKSIGTKSVSEFSSEIFRLLDRAKSIDSLSTSEKSSAIFQLMDDMPLASPTNASTLAFRNMRKPLSRPLNENRSSMPRIAEENHKEPHDTKTFRSEYSEAAKEEREDYPEVGLSFEEEDETSRNDPAPPEAKSTSNLSEESEEEDTVGNIDLVFVENFDRAFNEFIARHPKLLVSKPNLLHHIRVCKLQKVFEYMEIREGQILKDMQDVQEEKVKMEKDLHLKLREASRKKAARQICLQNDLQNLVLSTKHMEAKMGWKFVDACESRAKKQFQLRQKIKAKYPPPGANNTRHDLLQQIPEGEESETLRNAAHWPPTLEQSYLLSVEQEKDLRQFQVDNALKMSELTVLKRQLASYQILAKKHAWVESVLLRMDATTMSKLRTKFMKKLGVRM